MASVCYLDIVDSASGNVVVTDSQGHKRTICYRENKRSGKRYIVGPSAKRDLETHPYTEDEKQAKNLFALRAKQRKLILADDSLTEQYKTRYAAALAAGQVKIFPLTGKPQSFQQWLMTIRIDDSILGD